MTILLFVSWVVLSITLALGAIVAVRDWPGFQIAAAQLYPGSSRFVSATLFVIPASEALMALTLWVPVPGCVECAAVGAIGLLLLFTVLLARVARSGESVLCHCLSASGSRISWLSVGRNLILISAAGSVVGGSLRSLPVAVPWPIAVEWTGPALAAVLLLRNAELLGEVVLSSFGLG